MKRYAIAAVLFIGAALLAPKHHDGIAAGRHTENCWPFCAQQGPKPDWPCLPFTCAELAARNAAIIVTDLSRNHEPYHVGKRAE